MLQGFVPNIPHSPPVHARSMDTLFFYLKTGGQRGPDEVKCNLPSPVLRDVFQGARTHQQGCVNDNKYVSIVFFKGHFYEKR